VSKTIKIVTTIFVTKAGSTVTDHRFMTTHPLMDTSEPKNTHPSSSLMELCNHATNPFNFIIRHDRRSQFHFAALQSALEQPTAPFLECAGEY